MFRSRSLCALVLVLTPGLRADEKPASPWIVDRTLTVSPQPAPVASFKYWLLPPSWELKEGNAAPIYLRLTHEQNDASRKYWIETPKPWNELPIDKIPLDDARKFLKDRRYFLRQFELGARRKSVDWNYTLDEGDLIGLLLPDVQWMRGYAPMLVLQVRVAIAEGDFAKAVQHLQTGLAFGRQVGDAPFFINSLVGIALTTQFTSTVADFIERPGAPNLYWALTALPRPFIPLHGGRDLEHRLLELQFPDLADLDRERSPEQWDRLLRNIREAVRKIAVEGDPPKIPDWLPKDFAPEVPAAKSPHLAAARQYVAREKRLTAEQADAMPAAQMLLLYMVGTYHEHSDRIFEVMYLPYPQVRARYDAAMSRVRAAPPTSEGQVLARLLVPALPKVLSAGMRIDRHFAVLRTIEALRIYAAAHDGRLPEKLSDVTEPPLPDDPATGKPFGYTRDGDTATLTSQIPDDPIPNSGIRYKITVRKK